MRLLSHLVPLAIFLPILAAQPNSKTGSNPLTVGITRNQQELQELSTLIAQNNADMLAIVGDTLVSLAGAVAGAGTDSAFGQNPREAVANLISSLQNVKTAIETGKSALDGDAWLALSGQLKLTLDLIGETELPVRFANTLTDLLIKTAQLVSLARSNADLVAAKVQVAQAQTYLLAKAAAIQARRAAAQQTAAQSKLLGQIKAQEDAQYQWLLQQYKDRPQVIQLAVKTAAARNSRTASQVVHGMQAAGANSDVFNLSNIPGINPAAIAAMNRCNQIALTMVQRQSDLTAILDTCPKPAKPGDNPPPCPEYEAAAASNNAINRSSMTCNKDSSGQYIPFFSRSRESGTIAGSWGMLPGSYYTPVWNWGRSESEAQQIGRPNAGYLETIERIGPGHFREKVRVTAPESFYPIDLYGSDDSASGDIDIPLDPNPESDIVQQSLHVHLEATLSDGKLQHKETQTWSVRFSPNCNTGPRDSVAYHTCTSGVYYRVEYSICSRAR